VTASLFNLLGVNPILGRSFTEAEDRPGGIQAVVLISSSQGGWRPAQASNKPAPN
jgi:hypothetical protein